MIYFKKYLIVINENIKDNNIDKIFNKEIFRLSELDKFIIPNVLTAARVGIDNKKEIFTDSSLLKPRNLPAVIVIPDLLTPGIKDKIWKNPIYKADL